MSRYSALKIKMPGGASATKTHVSDVVELRSRQINLTGKFQQ